MVKNGRRLVRRHCFPWFVFVDVDVIEQELTSACTCSIYCSRPSYAHAEPRADSNDVHSVTTEGTGSVLVRKAENANAGTGDRRDCHSRDVLAYTVYSLNRNLHFL